MTDQLSLQSTEEQSPQNVLAMVLANPNAIKELDEQKLKTLFEIHKEHQDRQSKQDFIEAFDALRADEDFIPIQKLGQSDVHQYAKLDDIMAMLFPLMKKHGFTDSLSSKESEFSDRLRLVLVTRHRGGHQEEAVMDVPMDALGRAGRSAIQGTVSSTTYMSRIMRVNFWGIQFARDDDGQGASGIEPITPEQASEIRNMLDIVGAKESQITAVYGVHNIESLPSTLFQPAVNMLNQRAARQKDK